MTSSDSSIPTSVNESLINKNVQQVCLLWRERTRLLNSDFGLVSEIVHLENSIEQQLNRLYAFPEPVWIACELAISEKDYDKVFVISMIAFRGLNTLRIQAAVEFALDSDEHTEELITSLAWMPRQLSMPWVEKFIKSKNLDHKYIAMSVYSHWRENPGSYLTTLLQRDDCIRHERLLAVSLRVIGELKLREFLPVLSAPILGGSSSVAFWTIWSSIMLGKTEQATKLEGFVSYPGPFQSLAIDIFFRVVSVATAYPVVSAMANIAGNAKQLIRASIVLGDPKAIPWLINRMSDPECARLAGRAFSMITGIDLIRKDLVIDIPDITAINYSASEQSEETQNLSGEDILPWPDAEKIKGVWDRYGHQFCDGKRYVYGKPINAQRLKEYIDSDDQAVRRSAALELALFNSDKELMNVNVFDPNDFG